MFGRLRFFVADSYRLCVPELKSVGTTKFQDGCRDPDKLQNVFIFTLHHVSNIIVVCTRMLWSTSGDAVKGQQLRVFDSSFSWRDI